MNNSSKSKFFTFAVLVLIVLNLVTIGVFWFNHQKNNYFYPPHIPMGGNAASFLIKELALDSAQQTQYLTLKNEHRAKADSIRNTIRVAKDSLFNYLKQPNGNSILIDQALAKIGAEQMNFERSVFEHFKQLRAICNAKQQLKFDSVIHEALRMMAPGNRPPAPMQQPQEKMDEQATERERPERRPKDRNFNPPLRDDFNEGGLPPPPRDRDGRRLGPPPLDKNGKPIHPPRDGNRRPAPPSIDRDSMR